MITRLLVRLGAWLGSLLWKWLVGHPRKLEKPKVATYLGNGQPIQPLVDHPKPMTPEQEREHLEWRLARTRELFRAGTEESGVYERDEL